MQPRPRSKDRSLNPIEAIFLLELWVKSLLWAEPVEGGLVVDVPAVRGRHRARGRHLRAGEKAGPTANITCTSSGTNYCFGQSKTKRLDINYTGHRL